MAQQVVSGALLQCDMGLAPAALMVLPQACVLAGGPPAASIMDNVAFVNILPFAMCKSPANPAVAAATAAALGVLTPMPCTPMTPAPWGPGSPTVLIGGSPALDSGCKLICAFGGTISITLPGQFTVAVP